MKLITKVTGILLALSIVACICYGGYMIVMTGLGNRVDYAIHKVHDSTNYETRKKVEDTCRAYIASYLTDKATWEQYKDSESELERSWASQAMMRANKTANVYNEYILKNSFVWQRNVPEDIKEELQLLKE